MLTDKQLDERIRKTTKLVAKYPGCNGIMLRHFGYTPRWYNLKEAELYGYIQWINDGWCLTERGKQLVDSKGTK